MKRNKFKSKDGLTILEILFAVGILAFTLCGLLVTYTSAMVLIATSKNVNIATDAAMGLMEQIRSHANPCGGGTIPFLQIVNTYNCGSATPGYNGLTFSVNNIPENIGVVTVESSPSPLSTEFLQVTISICWRQGNRVIGEDQNLNWILEDEEDLDADNIIDSPAQVVTRITNR